MKIQLNDVALEMVERGPEDGLPVVLIHGFPFDHRMWDRQLSALSDRYRMLTYDVRGLGRSDVGDGQYTMELYVDDLLALLDELDPGPVVGCGLSMGGYILLRALEREPERFRAAVLADTRSTADDDETRLGRADAIRVLKAEGAGAYADSFVEEALGATTLAERSDVVEEVREMVRSNDPGGMTGAQLAMISRTDTTAVLTELTVPLLVIVGAEDVLTPPEGARAMAAEAPDGAVRVVPGAGHLSALENPEAFNRALREFLQNLG